MALSASAAVCTASASTPQGFPNVLGLDLLQTAIGRVRHDCRNNANSSQGLESTLVTGLSQLYFKDTDFYLRTQETLALFNALAGIRPLSPFTVRREAVVSKLVKNVEQRVLTGIKVVLMELRLFSLIVCRTARNYPVQLWVVRIQPDARHIALLLVITFNAVGRGFHVFYADVRTVFFQAVRFQQDVEFDFRRLGPCIGFMFIPWCSVWIVWHLHSVIVFRLSELEIDVGIVISPQPPRHL